MGLIVFTDKINSGKSSIILELSEKTKIFEGFIQLKHKSKRFIKFLNKGNLIEFTCEPDEGFAVLEIGNYLFKMDIFDLLNTYIIDSTKCLSNSYFVIDEWGLLEKNGLGLNKSIKYLIEGNWYKKFNYIIIVRDWLYNDFLTIYNLDEANILKYNTQSIIKVLNNC